MDGARFHLAQLNIALMVAPASANYLEPMLDSEQLGLLALAHSEALALQLPGARLVRLPSGILDYDRSRPPTDIDLIALVTRLVARDDLHPALVPLFTVADGDARIVVTAEAPIPIGGGGRRDAEQAAAAEYARRLEPYVLSYPGQWAAWPNL